ncbi:MAG: ribosome maturation factor RimP [Desulfatiglandaceae bacterium]
MVEDARSIEKNVEALIEPVLQELGTELVGVEYLVERGRLILRIYIDKPGGVTVDDCAQVSREIDVLIDVKGLVPGKYVLEVSSPGLNRRLRKQRDFDRAKGKKVKLRLKALLEGRRNFTGYLVRIEDEMIYLDVDGHEKMVPFQRIEKANIVYEF